MKTIRIFPILLIFAAFSSCMDKMTEDFTANSPVYMTYEELRSAVKTSTSRELRKPGKIYFKDTYIYVVEELEGIHVINIANPAAPQNITFIEIPGCIDIAIRNSTLYADSYVDLVAIDISNLDNINEIARKESVFPYTVPQPTDVNYRMVNVDSGKGVVVDWELKRVKKEIEYIYYPVYPVYESADYALSNSGRYTGASSSPGSSFGIGGSMARFGLYDDYLYAVDSYQCYIFDISNDALPESFSKQNAGSQIETMFIYDGHMFLGAMGGMYIYSLESPTVLKKVGQFWHVTSCDPVVIDDGYAYITLRGGQLCRSVNNSLEVVKLSNNYATSELIASFALTSPYGLGIDGKYLFVCDGDDGLKVFDATDKLKIGQNKIAAFPDINTYDVIPLDGVLFMIGQDGFFLYDYSDIENITLKGSIPVAVN